MPDLRHVQAPALAAHAGCTLYLHACLSCVVRSWVMRRSTWPPAVSLIRARTAPTSVCLSSHGASGWISQPRVRSGMSVGLSTALAGQGCMPGLIVHPVWAACQLVVGHDEHVSLA